MEESRVGAELEDGTFESEGEEVRGVCEEIVQLTGLDGEKGTGEEEVRQKKLLRIREVREV